MPVIRKGSSALPREAGSGSFMTNPADGEYTDFVPLSGLDEMISIDQHVFWGENGTTVMFACLQDPSCPGCALDNQPRYRGYLEVATQIDGDWQAKIFGFGVSVARSLADLGTMFPSGIEGQVLRLKRKGSGLRTKYMVLNVGKQMKSGLPDPLEVDIEDEVGVMTRERAIELLVENGHVMSDVFDTPAEDEEKPAAKKAKGKKANDDEWQ